jgi:hypothetical protein
MVTDQQVRRLKMFNTNNPLYLAADKAGMCENTARKYIRSGKLPSQTKVEHDWKTRKDPFEEVFHEVKEKLNANPGFKAKTIFQYLQRNYPGRFQDSQLRTLQRKIKQWRNLEGPAQEVYFYQTHYPGKLSASDFTSMSSLGITISGEPFEHLLYHFVLTYSNWETGTICFSESYESLSQGFQNALWELGKLPESHRTDCLSAAKKKHGDFTNNYNALLRHYNLKGETTNPRSPHENGDIEKRHDCFKNALEQALLLRGSRDFKTREDYNNFLKTLFRELNTGRKDKLSEELAVMKNLPKNRLEDCSRLEVKVSPGSTIRVNNNAYSVHSRLIGVKVNVRLYAEYLEVYYNQKLIEKIPRLKGRDKHFVQYRHIIDSLIKKPGAFENYRYRDDLFPNSNFRLAYDELKKLNPNKANKEYLLILHLAAKESEERVDEGLRVLLDQNKAITFKAVETIVNSKDELPKATVIEIDEVRLKDYDDLLEVANG